MGPRVWALCVGVGPRLATFARGLSSVPPMPASRKPLHTDRSSVGRFGPQTVSLATERPHPRPPRGARTRQLVRHSRLPQTPPHVLPYVSPELLSSTMQHLNVLSSVFWRTLAFISCFCLCCCFSPALLSLLIFAPLLFVLLLAFSIKPH